MTGRGLGYCNDFNMPGFTRGGRLGYGGGYGYGRGGGYGRGRGYWRGSRFRGLYYENYPVQPSSYSPLAPINPVDNLTILKQEKQYLESEMEQVKNAIGDISKRIEELEKQE
jgi:hypothetical protein